MIFWIREIAGWALIALGLLVFAKVYEMMLELRLTWGILFTVIGIFLFRGGIHLLKVAVAARICREAQQRLYPAAASGAAPLPTIRSPVRTGWRA